MTRAFNIEGLIRLQNYMGGKTLSDAQFFAVLNADVVEMIDGEESTTKRRYFRIAENDESIMFSCILGSSQQQMVVTKATKQLDVTTTEIGGAIAPGSITTEMLATGAVTSAKLAPGLDVSGLFFILPEGTQLPYTLTEEDKTKLASAHFIIVVSNSGAHHTFLRNENTYVGIWYQIIGPTYLSKLVVSETSISNPSGGALVPDAITYNAQTLTEEQQAQARANIGLDIMVVNITNGSATLTQEQADALLASNGVIFTGSGTTATQTARMKNRIFFRQDNSFYAVYNSAYVMYATYNPDTRVITVRDIVGITDPISVHFTAQTLTAKQKTQARTNIGAAEDQNTSGDSPATLEEPIL